MDDSSDYHNFSQTSSAAHRLPTLNGAQALLGALEKQKPCSTGIDNLDATLRTAGNALSQDGGILRGCLTEVYGPPGCGKTSLGIQLAANVLQKQDDFHVVWIDTSTDFPIARLEAFLVNSSSAQSDTGKTLDGHREHRELEAIAGLTHLHISSLPHLLALILHPSEEFPPENTSLIVIDDLSNIVTVGLPQNEKLVGTYQTPTRSTSTSMSTEAILSKAINQRRAAMLSAISCGLSRLAASLNIAVVVLNKASSYRKEQNGVKSTILRSMLNTTQWDENVNTRIALYRDFWPEVDWAHLGPTEAQKQRRRHRWPLRVAEVEKVRGQAISAAVCKFVILKDKLYGIDPPKDGESVHVALPSSPAVYREDNDGAMGNLSLGLEDATEAEDDGLRMPEDALASSPSVQLGAKRLTKRKIDEVADSEDEEELDLNLGGDIARHAPSLNIREGFLPSSQLGQDRTNDVSSLRIGKEGQGITEDGEGVEDDDEMLLRD